MSGVLYNVTIKIDNQVSDEWLSWMQEVHIPDVMATACFKSYKLCRLVGHDDDDGITYAIQYEAPSEDLLLIYQQEHAKELQKAHQQKFEGKYVAFRSLLRVIDHG